MVWCWPVDQAKWRALTLNSIFHENKSVCSVKIDTYVPVLSCLCWLPYFHTHCVLLHCKKHYYWSQPFCFIHALDVALLIEDKRDQLTVTTRRRLTKKSFKPKIMLNGAWTTWLGHHNTYLAQCVAHVTIYIYIHHREATLYSWIWKQSETTIFSYFNILDKSIWSWMRVYQDLLRACTLELHLIHLGICPNVEPKHGCDTIDWIKTIHNCVRSWEALVVIHS